MNIDIHAPPAGSALGLFIYCRSGFEQDCADEIVVAAAQKGFNAHVASVVPASGYVLASIDNPAEAVQSLPFWKLAFARQWFLAVARLRGLPKDGRVECLMERLTELGTAARDLFVETLDIDATRPLLRLCRSIETHLAGQLRGAGLLYGDATTWRLHVCFTATDEAVVGFAPTDNSHPSAMGIPRLRFPKGAPSRSALKLEEALATLLRPSERRRWLKSGMSAVDLGAAPGGWSWVLAKNGLAVTAVDNGALAPAVASLPLLRHVRADGLRFRPERPVDWLVCDIIEKPQLVTETVERWAGAGWCRNVVVNLKLPMKARYPVVAKLLPLLTAHCRADRWSVKQLYHDRDEITCYLRLET